MHIKAHAGKGLTNADIEEIVTNISPKPQSWRYISFSTAERSPKCNSTQEKSPSEQCVHTGKWKQHQDTLENQALPYLISKIWCSTFKKLSIRQNQALPCLISQIWRSRFNKLSIRQNHALPLLISKIWRSRFKRNVNPTKSGFALTIFQIFMDYRKIVNPTKSGSALPNF